MRFNPDEIKKILIIKPRGIGDIILSTIVIDNLRNQFIDAKIDYLVESFAKEILENNPLINKIITFNKSDFILKTIWEIRKEKYNLIIDLWSNPKTAQITFLSGAKYRVGYSYRGRKYAYNIYGPAERGNYHSALHNLELLYPLNVKIISKRIYLFLDNESKIFADDFFKENKISKQTVVGIIPSGGWNSKRCPSDKWLEICNALIQQLNCKLLILWGPGDENDATFIKSKLEANCIIAPEITLKQMTALINKCSLIISNDSGPMHISAALGIPTLGLFGPTDPKKHGPFSDNSDFIIVDDLHCITCNKLECPFNKECFYNMNLNTILDKCKKLLHYA